MYLTVYQNWDAYHPTTIDRACSEKLSTNWEPEINGEGKEAFTARILGYLNIQKVSIVPRTTVADEVCKWDILLQIDNERVFPLQIKSSEIGRLKHENSTPKFNYKEIPHCPCLVVEQRFDRARFGFSILVEIFKALETAGVNDIALSPAAKTAIDLHKALKAAGVKEIPHKSIGIILKNNAPKILIDLGLGALHRGNFVLF
ncbi:MAG: hypothetical protein HC778_00320 [Chamaesiphon sp. CSU_1_12]|nr:hypothetical protein [Chamaesiphon sp. CSU_1_12]